jgi:hypothetical protein
MGFSMAAILQAQNGADAAPSNAALSPENSGGPRAHIARLAELHDEAAETALLANLLGRMPYIAAALAAAGGAVALLSHAAVPPLLTWLVLVAAGLIAVMRAYVTTIAAPFERAPLRFFARDLQAIMLYVGFAWGAGSFLALPATVGVLQALAFSAGAIVLVALVVRASDAVACFAIPVTVLSVAAALIQPFANGALASAAILAAGLLVMAASYFSERMMIRPQDSRLATIASN